MLRRGERLLFLSHLQFHEVALPFLNYFPICHLGNQVFANVNLLQRMLCLSYIYLLTSLRQTGSMAQTTCRALQYKGIAFVPRHALINYNGLADRKSVVKG